MKTPTEQAIPKSRQVGSVSGIGLIIGALLAAIPAFAFIVAYEWQSLSGAGGPMALLAGVLTSPVGLVLVVAMPFIVATMAASIGGMVGWGVGNVVDILWRKARGRLSAAPDTRAQAKGGA